MTDEAKIELARRLFEEGWSGDSPESPLQFLSDDVVMRDIVAHVDAMHGHQAIVDFFGPGAGNLKVMPEQYYLNERGVALTWMAYLHIINDHHGAENKGKWLCGEGMSLLEFRGDKVCLEIDYWHGPQGMCDDWRSHLDARKAMSPGELGAISGA